MNPTWIDLCALSSVFFQILFLKLNKDFGAIAINGHGMAGTSYPERSKKKIGGGQKNEMVRFQISNPIGAREE